MFRITTYDYIFALLILLASAGSLFSFRSHETDATTATVYQNNVLIKEVALPVSGTQSYVLDSSGITMEVKDSSVRISKTTCPLQVCRHAGWISAPWQTIACVPNKLLIKIVNSSKNTLCDTVTY